MPSEQNLESEFLESVADKTIVIHLVGTEDTVTGTLSHWGGNGLAVTGRNAHRYLVYRHAISYIEEQQSGSR